MINLSITLYYHGNLYYKLLPQMRFTDKAINLPESASCCCCCCTARLHACRKKQTAVCRVGIFHVNPRFHPIDKGWNLGLTWKFPCPEFRPHVWPINMSISPSSPSTVSSHTDSWLNIIIYQVYAESNNLNQIWVHLLLSLTYKHASFLWWWLAEIIEKLACL